MIGAGAGGRAVENIAKNNECFEQTTRASFASGSKNGSLKCFDCLHYDLSKTSRKKLQGDTNCP